jgi:tetratricopeptide (TPR) repeat protein
MKLTHLSLTLAALGFCLPSVARAQPPRAPQNVNVEAATPRAAKLTSEAATAEAAGEPQAALKLAERAIEADARAPWGYYDKGAALSRIGKTDDALSAFAAAEQRFALSDQWGRSVAIYGRAHALDEARRCDEAREEYNRYAAFVRERDPKSADMATRYAADCKAPAPTASAARL